MKKNIFTVILLSCIGLILSGCNFSDNEKSLEIENISNTNEQAKDEAATQTTTQTKTPQNKIESLELNMENSANMEIANGWTNGQMFDCTWRASNVNFSDGIMSLKIDSDGDNTSPKWSGGEFRTKDFYQYGLYEVRMKPIKNEGVVSSFFTYTGPSDGNIWDEIDIEFLGKDTTKVQFNYFSNGKGEHEYSYDLGYDASEEFHEYGFKWFPDSITWYVDGEEVFSASKDIPVTPSKIMMNVWPGVGVDAWLGKYDGNIPLTAEYDWVRFTPIDSEE